MSHGEIHESMRAVLAEVGARMCLPVDKAELLRLHSNALFALPSTSLVIRIATNPDVLHQVAASVRVTRWLGGRGFPCVVPADLPGHPRLIGGHVVSLWRYVNTAPPPPGGADLGWLLRNLHTHRPPHRLRTLSDPLKSVSAAVASSKMPAGSHEWLDDRIAELRRTWCAMDFPHSPVLVHGDAHPNNFMREVSGRVLLGDWDHVAMGPREWDLAQIHYARRRFGYLTQRDVDDFTEAYGWDAREWSGLDSLIEIREISGLSPYIRAASAEESSRRELAHRLETLQARDVEARWSPPPQEKGVQRV